MARRASGEGHRDAAQALLRSARTVDELRTAQAVLLPLLLGLSIEQTALAIGRCAGATCSLRTRFFRIAEGVQPPPRGKRELRNRAHATLQEERRLLGEVFGQARQARADAVQRLHLALEQRLGKQVARSSVYRLMQRHGWQRPQPGSAAHGSPPSGMQERRARAAPRWVRPKP